MADELNVEVEKAKKRIERMLKTGKSQHRVKKISDEEYEYKAKHHVRSLLFKVQNGEVTFVVEEEIKSCTGTETKTEQ